MGFFDGLFNPTKNTQKGYKKARKDFRNTRKITDPFYRGFVDDGGNARGMLADFFGLNGADAQRLAFENYQTSPEFDFQFERGQGALDSSALARGGLQSGAHSKDLQQFGQGLFAQDFGNRVNQLSGMVGYGFQGAGGLTNNSQIMGNLGIGLGQAKDAGNEAIVGNTLGLGSTVLSAATGMPINLQGGQAQGLSRLFQQPQQPTSYQGYGNGRIDPWVGLRSV